MRVCQRDFSQIMKYLRLFQLAMHRGAYIRSRSLVWFLMTIFVPGILCMYWIVAIRQNPALGKSLSTTFMVTYYLTVVTMASLIVSHIKDHVARQDIQQGEFSQYLLRPFSYYVHYILFEEIPYRVIQGGYGIVVITLIAIFFPNLIQFSLSPLIILYTVAAMSIGFFICFTLEMILGLLALWFYDLRLFHSAYEVMFILLGGWNMPLFLFPKAIYTAALFTPFPAVIYVPTMLLSGKISTVEAPLWLLYQMVWLVVILIVHAFIWRHGLRKFTAAGI